MQATISGVKITGLCATVPNNISKFTDEMKHFPFPEKSSLRLAKVMGFKEHRVTDAKTTLCDLASYTLNYMFHKGYLQKDKLQAMIVISQNQDHPVPGNSKVIHGLTNLPKSVYCMDLYENCIGFISGLLTASSLINAAGFDEVLIVTTETSAYWGNIKDRNTYPLGGDAAAVTVVKKSDNPDDKIVFWVQNDGSRREVLITPAGRCRMPYSDETARVYMDEMGNYRSLNNLHMDGTAVFQFVMEEVPPMIDAICEYAGVEKSEIEYHITHQPNKFMLEKLADLLKVSRTILFNNVVEYFGNSSCVTIPVNMAYNLGKKMLDHNYRVCFSAFGAGLSLASAITSIGPFDFCDFIEHPGEAAIAYDEKNASEVSAREQ